MLYSGSRPVLLRPSVGDNYRTYVSVLEFVFHSLKGGRNIVRARVRGGTVDELALGVRLLLKSK